ncbi:hypothetical protein MTP99_018914, partial [Tenebrio molitor]
MAKKKAVCDVSTSSHNSVRRTLSKAGKANEQNGDLVGKLPGGPKVSLFNFPKDKDLKARWVQAIKRQGENGKSFVPTASSKVCELHFHEQDILRLPLNILDLHLVLCLFTSSIAHHHRLCRTTRLEERLP